MIGQLFVWRIISLLLSKKEIGFEKDPQISELQKKVSKDKVNFTGLGEEE
jgi:hypothetical protein|tara:strand:- start:284 stop:433 length:150 start_codon:yes stop_codon:yes gene_type:complete